MNLKPKKKTGDWHDNLHKKYLVGVVAIAFVLMINQIVFSVLLKNRDTVAAFTSAAADYLYRDLGDQNVAAGTNNVVLAELWVPDGITREGLACGFQLDDPATGYDNLCFKMVEADGFTTTGAGLDDDGAKYVMNLAPANDIISASSLNFTPGDCVYTDNLVTPLEIYVDGNCDGIPNNGGVDVLILDKNGAGLGLPLYTDVSTAVSWLHSETVQSNGAYDYNAVMSGNVYMEPGVGSGGRCPTASLTPVTLNDVVMWSDLQNDGVFNPDIDVILWDNASCLSGAGACADGGCTGVPLPIAGGNFVEIYVYDGGGSPNCPGIAGDGVYQPGEPVWIDNSALTSSGIMGIYDLSDGVALPPSGSCLTGSGTEIGFSLLGAKQVESIWIANIAAIREDQVLQPGSLWNAGGVSYIPGTQWQGDAPGTWAGNEAFSDGGIYGVFDGIDTAVIDYDGDNTFTVGADVAVDCDGSTTTGVGTCATLNEGDSLSGYFSTAPFQLCTDSIFTPTCVWSDDDLDSNCNTFTTQTLIIGVPGCETTALTTVMNWSFLDGSGGTIGSYDLGEDIYKGPGIESMAYGTYSTRADLDVYSAGWLMHGNSLLPHASVVGPNGFKIIYADADGDGVLGATDTILEDRGSIQTGPVIAPNGNNVIDRIANAFNYVTLYFGPYARPGVDFTNVRLQTIPDWFGQTGFCSGSDLPLTTLIDNNGYYTFPALPPASNSILPFFTRFCVVADIPAGAKTNARITPQIPRLTDANNNKQYDPGDRGLFLLAQNTSGPTSGDLVSPYTITVTSGVSAPNTGSYNPPASPGEVNVFVLEVIGGEVMLSWIDPVAIDIDKLVVYRDGEIIGEVDLGVQTFTDSNVIPGQTYKYKILARDIEGTLSLGPEKSITIPQELAAPEVPACQLPAGVAVGDLIMADGQSTVYLVSDECKRNPFPNENVFLSYYSVFPDKADISLSIDIISQISFGENMTLRPGTYLMKVTTVPKVYAIEPGGVMRWITTEQIASSLYGVDWAKRVIDMPDTFFIDYQTGADVDSAVYPAGSLIRYSNETTVWYIENSQKRLVSSAVFNQQNFQDEFVIKNVNASNFIFTEGAPLVETAEFSIAMAKNSGFSSKLFPFLANSADLAALLADWQDRLK